VIEVSELDPKTPTFPKPGYYLVLGLELQNAASLFEPPQLAK
jgi:hypothetical protein